MQTAILYIKKMTLIAGIALLGMTTGYVLMGGANTAHASPLTLFSDSTTCTLPDGSQGVQVHYSDSWELNYTCCPPKSTDNISCLYDKYLNPTINLLAALVGVVVVISIVWGALEYTMSAGDPQKANSGRKRITNALIALLAFILLYGFLQFIVPGGFLNG